MRPLSRRWRRVAGAEEGREEGTPRGAGPRRPPGRASPLVLAALIALLAAPADPAEIRDLLLEPDGDGLKLSLRLDGAFPEPVEERIRSGLEVSFEYTVRLRRRRSRFVDKNVSERYVVVSVHYSTLTKMYRVTRRVDGTVTDTELTARREAMRDWMSRIDGLKLFDGRDLAANGTYYARVKAKLLSGFRMLVLPWDLETAWVETERLSIRVRP